MSISTDSTLPERLAHHLDPVVRAASDGPITGEGRVPGVVAGVTTDAETVYLRASGVRALDADTAMTTDTIFGIFSTTKAVTATAALTLVDAGQLDLDAPASDYLPELAELTVLEGFEPTGHHHSIIRPSASIPTTRQLLTHTSGFAYSFYQENLLRLAQDFGYPDIATCRRASIQTPLVFDPGTDWLYGTGVDWVGLIIEAITGQRLGTVMAERIFGPLGMSDTAFGVEHTERLTTLHHRRPDGSLKPNHRFAPVVDPEVHMGGHGLYSTVTDYLTFLRLWLNDGRTDDGTQIVSAAIIAEGSRDQLHGLALGDLTSTVPGLSNDAKFLPGQSWSLAFARDGVDAPTGRSAGSQSWAGLANLYFWLDPQRKVAGYWAAQLFPFADHVAFGHYQAFEAATYRALG